MKLKKLREKHAKAYARAQALAQGDQFSQEAFDAAIKEADHLAAQIKAQEQLAEREALAGAVEGAAKEDADRRSVSVDEAEAQAEGWLAGLGAWARAQSPENREPLADEHRRALNAEGDAVRTTSDATGGTAVLADGVAGDMFYRVMQFSAPVFQIFDVRRRQRGNKAHIPGVNDNANYGRIISEGSKRQTNVPSFVKSDFDFDTFDSDYLPVSYEALQDMDIRDIGGELVALAARRIGRLIAHVTSVGKSGTAVLANRGTPKATDGIVEAASDGLTTAANNAVTADEFISLTESIDPAYEVGGRARLMASKSVMTKFRLIKDSDGRYMFEHMRDRVRQPAAPFEDVVSDGTIDGVPYCLNNEMPALTAGKVAAVYGDLRSYILFLAREIRIERFHDSQTAEQREVWFAGCARGAGVLPDSAAVKKLTIKA